MNILEVAVSALDDEFGFDLARSEYDLSDVVHEGGIIGTSSNIIRSTAAVIIDSRTSDGFDLGDTGLLIAQDVSKFEWVVDEPKSGPFAWTVLGCELFDSPGGLTIELDTFPSAQLTIVARHFRYLIGNVPGQSEAPPDLTRDPTGKRFQHWQSTFLPAFWAPIR